MHRFLLLIFSLTLLSKAQMPNFQPAENMIANGSIIAVGGHAAPQVEDWDNDGKKDLLIGQFSGSKIRLYLNSGSNESPELTNYSYLKADGKDLTTSAG